MRPAIRRALDEVPDADPATVTARYEQLRAAVLRGAGAGWRHGWAVLVGTGMAAWVRAIARIAPEPAGTPAPPAGPSGQVAAELMQVLVAMVLARPMPP